MKADFDDRTEYDESVSIEICIYAVEFYSLEPMPSVDTILEYGECQTVANSTLPTYFDNYVFPRSGYYYLHVFAHRDRTPVPIPALPLREDGQAYVALVRTAACILSPAYVESDSTSVTIQFHSTWPFYGEPALYIYYSSDPEQTPYTSVLPVVTRDISQEDYYYYAALETIGDLANNTEYYFYMIARDGANQTDFSMLDTFITGHTYDFCRSAGDDGLLDYGEIGVGETAEVQCTIGSIGRHCYRAENWTALYGDEINECYCEQTVLHDHELNQTRYHDSHPITCGGSEGSVPCGYKGIWGAFENCVCGREDDIWVGETLNVTEVFLCGQGSLLRECKASGFWGSVTDVHCYCPHDGFWSPAPVSTTPVEACAIGSRSRVCNKFGQWEEPDLGDCACAAVDQWPSLPAGASTELLCPIGKRSRRCDESGAWEPVDTAACFCPADGDWPQTQAGTSAVQPCGSGSAVRTCNIDGTWSEPVSRDCMCAGSLIWPATPAGETASAPCPNDAASSMTRLCNALGQWESTVNTDSCFELCEQKGSFYPVPVGQSVTVTCPNNAATITMTCQRDPAAGPVWGDYSVSGDCSCPYDGVWSPVAVGEEARIDCDIGYKTRRCNPYTTAWDEEVDHGCQCAATSGFETSAPGETASAPCGLGAKFATCNARGHWSAVNYSQCNCTLSEVYGSAAANTDKLAICPESGGYRTIRCDADGQWVDEDVSNCRCAIPPVFKDSWTEGLLVGESYVASCAADTGFDISCSQLGVTVVLQANCSCAADDQLRLPLFAAGEVYTHQCGSNHISAKCDSTGTWVNYINTCSCPATSDFPATPAGSWASPLSGGCMRRLCNDDAQWEAVDYSQCTCGGDANDSWTLGHVGETVYTEQPCGVGRVAGQCTINGIVDLDYSECYCAADPLRSLPQTLFGELAPSVTCGSGSVQYKCGSNGAAVWISVGNNDCVCVDDTTLPGEVMMAEVGSKYTAVCGAGTAEFECLPSGVFAPGDYSKCKCPPDLGFEATLVGTTASISCPNDLSGETKIYRECLAGGVWESIENAHSSCRCPATGNFVDAEGVAHVLFPATDAGQSVTVTCPSSGLSIDRYCQYDGNWAPESGTCPSFCPTDGPFSSVQAVAAPSDDTTLASKYTCSNGFTVYRWCLQGEDGAAHWADADWTGCGCNADDLTDAVLYTENVTSESVSRVCGNGESLTRACTYGQWQAIDYGNCQCAPRDDTYYVFPVAPNTYYSIDCVVGLKGGYCNAVGQWDEDSLTDSCACPELYVADDLTLPSTAADSTYVFDCDQGQRARNCLTYGYWSGAFDDRDCKCKNDNEIVSLYDTVQLACQKEGSYQYSRCQDSGHLGISNAKNCLCHEDSFWGDLFAGSNKTHVCSSNGSLTRECTVAGWSEDITNAGCFCASPELPDGQLGETVHLPCGPDAAGSKSVVCLPTGFFDEVVDDSQCVAYCPQDGEWPSTAPGTVASISTCPEHMHGRVERACNADGTWNATTVTFCTYLSCPADDGFYSVLGGQTSYKDCDAGYTGRVARYCDYSGAWSAPDTSACTRIKCVDEDGSEILSGTYTTKLCPTGYTGSIKRTCSLEGELSIENTCTLMMCPAIEGVVASHPYNTTVEVGCDSGFTGFREFVCDENGSWRMVHNECSILSPELSCVPANEQADVARQSFSDGLYTIRCESNVPIVSVDNDAESNINVFVLFETEQTSLRYYTSSRRLSDYVYAFEFANNFPSNATGHLFIQEQTFSSASTRFPLTPIVNKFYTVGGIPLAPSPINTALITTTAVDYDEGTVDVNVPVDFDSNYYLEAELTVEDSTVAPILFAQSSVAVPGLLLNVPVGLRWRVRNEYGWSESSATVVYTPTSVPGRPGKPVATDFSSSAATWTWTAAEDYGEPVLSYTYTVYVLQGAEHVFYANGTVLTSSATVDLQPEATYAIEATACSASGCGPVSERSDDLAITSLLTPPSAVRDLKAAAYAANKVKVSWKAPADAGSAPVDSYTVMQYHGSDLVATVTTTSRSTLVPADRSLLYTYTVYASSSVGDGASSSVDYQLPALINGDFEYYPSDGAITVAFRTDYTLQVTCSFVKKANPAVYSDNKSFTASPNMLNKHTYSLLEAATTYTETCTIQEVHSQITEQLDAHDCDTLATPAVVPEILEAAPTKRGSFYTLYVSYHYAGAVSCFLTTETLDGSDASIFELKETYSCTMEHNEDGCSVELLTDGEGDSFEDDVAYNYYCYHERTVVVDNSPVVYTYPDVTSSSRRLLGADDVFDIVAISPEQYTATMNPDASIVIEFSEDAAAASGDIVLLSSSSEELRLPASSKSVVCRGSTCEVSLPHGLLNNETYSLSIDKTAFKSKRSNRYLEESLDNYIFSTGKKSCTPDYIIDGLEGSRLCQCYSSADKCECNCGSTSLLREL